MPGPEILEKTLFLEELLCSKEYGILSSPEMLPTIQELSWLSIYFTAFPKGSSLHNHAFGVGVSRNPQQAKLKALCEGIERWAVFSPPPTIRSRRMSLVQMMNSGDRCISPARWNFAGASQQTENILWTQSIQHKKSPPPTWCPYSLCETHSSGFACHDDLEKATAHAFWELVERDHFLDHWWRRRPFQRIDKNTLPPCLQQELLFYLGALYPFIDFYYETDRATGLHSIFTRWRYQGSRGPAFLIGGACRPHPEDSLWSGLLEVLANLNVLLLQEQIPTPMTSHNFQNLIQTPVDRIQFYRLEENAKITDFYFENPVEFSWDQLASGAPSWDFQKIFCLNMTPDFAKAGGCFVTRILSPDLIPMDGAHSRLPRYHPRLNNKDIPPDSLQDYPHPYP
jgi:hypothetical protein